MPVHPMAAELLELLQIPSPTGLTEAALDWTERKLGALGVPYRRTRKGALLWSLAGDRPALTFSAHVDTLGAMVKEILPSGRLRLSPIGGYDWASIEGEYATVHLQDGGRVSATVLNQKQSTHIFGPELRELRRSADTMELRLDADTRSAEQTRELGIGVGDFVSWDSRATLAGEGYIKGRHLDDKAGVIALLAATAALKDRPAPGRHAAHFFLSNYEEVGHGAARGIPEDTDTLIAVDMAAVGPGQTSDEHCVSICLKDAGGPYDHAASQRIRAVAAEEAIDLRCDLYTYYSADATAAWRSGGDFAAALIGPGVDASHSYERTHQDALIATARLIGAIIERF